MIYISFYKRKNRLSTKNIFYCLVILLFNVFYSFGQQTETVDFIRVKAIVKPVSVEKKVTGTITYSFRILKKCDSVYLNASGIILFNNTSENKIEVTSKNKKIWFVSNFKANQTYNVTFRYEANPKKALYFLNNQIWTQGQGKYTSNWLPSIDDMNDKIEFDISYIIPSDKRIVANGNLLAVTDIDGYKQWDFDMKNPMSSYLVAFAVGDFSDRKISSSNGTSLELYYFTRDSSLVEPTYRYSKIIFDFIENEIGFKYPWQNYKQVPLKDFMYAGMENTSATFFSDAFMVDSIAFNDRNYVNVNAHELAHQWFGNLVTETSSANHWLHEGFASYYALLAEKEIFGEEYYYWKLYQSAEQLKSLSEEGKGEALNNPKASSLTFYEKGAWALHILKEQVGELVFKKAIKSYLDKFQFKNVTINDFLNEVEITYGRNLNDFRKDWVSQSAFKSEQAYQSLMKSKFINDYFKISALRGTMISLKLAEFQKALNIPNDFIGQEVIYQLEGEPISITLPLYKKAFNSNNVFIRQAIALTMSKIPKELKSEYESLLKDDSYLTQEAALGNLWVNFPEEKAKYLDETNNVIGFNDKNIRQFWLFIALITEDYNVDKKEAYLSELKHYTSSSYSYNVREKAIEYIGYLEKWDHDTFLNLIDAGQHHYWRFRDFSRDILKGLLASDKYRKQIILLGYELDSNSLNFLNRMINEN